MSKIYADIVLVGGGIMSATLGTLLSRLDPSLQICLIEQLEEAALESSEALNNAGTGHAAYCELNYTPQAQNGQIEIKRALEINTAFEMSLEFWSHLIEEEKEISPSSFINQVPHMSAVWGEKNIEYLRRRYDALKKSQLFSSMKWSDDPQVLEGWIPLMMKGRSEKNQLAATRIEHGTDIDFGALTKLLINSLKKNPNFKFFTQYKVENIKRTGPHHKHWQLSLTQTLSGEIREVETPFTFLGAGGMALSLLQKSGIPEASGYGGFPVSGQWLICQNESLIKKHHAKVYGLAALGAPPMSVPHLDTRIINQKRSLLFGPYAGFTTRFLKNGSLSDLMKSIKVKNLKSLLGVGFHNLDLTKYLINEALQNHDQRLKTLRTFIQETESHDWKLAHAGIRVQIIKPDSQKWGKLEFGTEIVSSGDGTLAALLGASPGASISVKAMLEVIERCFPKQFHSSSWQNTVRSMIPSYGQSLDEDAELFSRLHEKTLRTLKLEIC